jgi:hypothetical protein
MRSALLALVYIFLAFLAVPVLFVCVLFGLRDAFLVYGRTRETLPELMDRVRSALASAL